jgi:hypothetical protein
LREKLKETELAKEQLLADMSQALGLKDAAEKARAESTMEAAERAGIGARELSKVAGELEGARAEIAGLREKLKETELAKEQLLTDMSQALGLKEEELAALERRRKEDEAAKEKRAAEVCARVMGRLMHGKRLVVFETWHSHAMEQRRMREVCSRIVYKMKNQGLDVVFTTWCDHVDQQKTERAEKARAESVMEAAERAGIGARELSKVAGELEGARQELMKSENARKGLEAEVEALTAQLDAGQGEVKIVKAEMVRAQRSCMETQSLIDDLKKRQQKVREEGLKKLTARMLWKSVRFEFDVWRGETTASLHLLKVGYLEEERDERAKALGEAVAAADKLERDISTLKEAMASQQAASLDKVKSLTAEMQDEAARRMEEAAAALADREAEIAGLREKLKETELAKEQLLADMSQALGLKDAAEKARAESTMEAAEGG